MHIDKNLRRLWLDRGYTQEDLARRVGVTVDELLGMEEIKGSVWSAYAHANALQVEGEFHAAAEVFEEAIKTHPADAGLVAARAQALAMAGEGIGEAIEACERLLAGVVSEKRRATSVATLCFLYRAAGGVEKAARLASECPHARESRELLLPHFLAWPEREAYLREHLPGVLADLCSLIDGDTDEETLRRISLGVYQDRIDAVETCGRIAGFLAGA